MTRCPWHGLPCDCAGFPWTVDGMIPEKCETGMPDALPDAEGQQPMKHIGYVLIGAAIIVTGVVAAAMLHEAWLQYQNNYFFEVNRVILCIGLIWVAYWIGKSFVASVSGDVRKHRDTDGWPL